MTTTDTATLAAIHHATRKAIEKLVTMLAAEYPALTLSWEMNEDESRVRNYVVTAEGTTEVVYEDAARPDLAALLEACEDMGIDPTGAQDEDEDEDEDEGGGSVVPEYKRAEYRARAAEAGEGQWSDPSTCGDWMAEFLHQQCHRHNEKGRGYFSIEDFSGVLSANGVDMSGKWAQVTGRQSPGWQGRFRMNGRQKLEVIVAERGAVLTTDGIEIRPDAGWLASKQAQFAKAIAKLRKARAKAAEAKSGE